MDIGKKIKNLRVEKLMTQAELAGGEITRNMLSQIENGIALPSLTTVIYLANRLGVSAGFLLADEKDDFMYKKLNTMKNIKKAFTDKSFEICRDLCLYELEQTDDEIELILSHCCINLAIENIARYIVLQYIFSIPGEKWLWNCKRLLMGDCRVFRRSRCSMFIWILMGS